MQKRGTDILLLLMEAVGIALNWEEVTSPRYMREPTYLSCSSLEVSYVSISKSSITLRCFNMSVHSLRNAGAKVQNFWQSEMKRDKKNWIILEFLSQVIRDDRFLCFLWSWEYGVGKFRDVQSGLKHVVSWNLLGQSTRGVEYKLIWLSAFILPKALVSAWSLPFSTCKAVLQPAERARF